MQASPLAPRISSAIVWSGTELIVWGGRGCASSCEQAGELLVDGAAYDPGPDGWRVLARSPLAARAGAVAAWTGREMLIWGGSASVPLNDGAAYDPVTDRWRLLAPGPVAGGPTCCGHDWLITAVRRTATLIVDGDPRKAPEPVGGNDGRVPSKRRTPPTE